MKKKILIIVGVLILGGLISGFIYWFEFVKPKDLCASFPKIEGEVSCHEARALAIEKYPGEVKYIKKSQISLEIRRQPEIEIAEKDVWLIGINLKKPIEAPVGETKSIEVSVNRDDQKLLIYRLMSGQIQK